MNLKEIKEGLDSMKKQSEEEPIKVEIEDKKSESSEPTSCFNFDLHTQILSQHPLIT